AGNSIVAATGVVTYAAAWSGTSVITATALGCNGPTTETHTVTTIKEPNATTGNDVVICNGESVTIGATAIAGNSYSWTPITGLSLTTISNPTANPILTTTYTLTETVTATACVNTNSVTVTVNNLPAITEDPTNQMATEDESVSFSVVANGTALTYQWKKGTVGLGNAGNISGATSATLTINPVTSGDAATNYHVVVSGTCAPSITSANASLIVTVEGSVITIEPIEAVSCSGSAAIFSVTAVGSNLTYQWKKGTVDFVDGGNISGATSATFTIDPVTILDMETNYNVVVSMSLVPIDTSVFIALVLNEIPVITSAPVTQTACVGILSTFSVTATGTDLTYQWRKGTVDLIDGGNISGVTTNSLTINPVMDSDGATNYNVVVSGACSPSVTSANVSLEITPDGIDPFVFGTTANLIKVYPNPFTNSINIIINDELLTNMKGAYELAVYDALGSLVKHTTLIEKVTTIETFELKSGFYFYKVTDNEILIQTGKLISK
ncbi:MAG: T9SS type A sorting domain-containing protein, partial [Salinivirgaceae bacterium]